MFYPTKRESVKRGVGTFRAKTAQEYCWTAKLDTRLEGRVRK